MGVLIVLFMSILLIYFAKMMNSGKFSPVSMISWYWIIWIVASLLGTITLYSWDYTGVIWIYSALFLFCLFYFAGAPFSIVTVHRKSQTIKLGEITSISWIFLLLLIVLGMVKWGLQVYTNGFGFENFLSIDSLAEMNHEFAVNRYSGNGMEGGIIGAVISILNAMVYAAPLCGGFSYPYTNTSKKKILSIFSLSPSILVTLTNNTKAGMIGSFLLFFSSFFIGYYCKYNSWPKIKLKKIILGIIGFFLFLGSMLFSMVLRMGSVDLSTLAMAFQKIIVYAFGNVQSFDIWFSRYAGDESNLYGMMTFLGIADTLGLIERVQGVYSSLMDSASNVFTVFRGLISDFGILGGMVFVALLGLLLRVAVNSIHKSFNPCISATFSISVLFFFTFGIFISPWTYLSFIVAFLILWFYIFMAYYNIHYVENVDNKETYDNRANGMKIQ